MTTTYTWDITSISGLDPDTDGDCETIISASWILTGNDGAHTATITGFTDLNMPMTDGTDPEGLFATLTEAEVIAAVQEALGANTISSYHTNLDASLAAKALPQPITPSLPWA